MSSRAGFWREDVAAGLGFVLASSSGRSPWSILRHPSGRSLWPVRLRVVIGSGWHALRGRAVPRADPARAPAGGTSFGGTRTRPQARPDVRRKAARRQVPPTPGLQRGAIVGVLRPPGRAAARSRRSPVARPHGQRGDEVDQGPGCRSSSGRASSTVSVTASSSSGLRSGRRPEQSGHRDGVRCRNRPVDELLRAGRPAAPRPYRS